MAARLSGAETNIISAGKSGERMIILAKCLFAHQPDMFNQSIPAVHVRRQTTVKCDVINS